MVYKFFDKKSAVNGVSDKIKQNQQLADELHKLIIKKFKIKRVYSSFTSDVWGADLADMQLISKLIKELSFYYVLLIFLLNMHGLFL